MMRTISVFTAAYRAHHILVRQFMGLFSSQVQRLLAMGGHCRRRVRLRLIGVGVSTSSLRFHEKLKIEDVYEVKRDVEKNKSGGSTTGHHIKIYNTRESWD